MNNYPWWVSSTGQGIAQRILSLVTLIIPILSYFGVNIAQADAQAFINGLLVVVFGLWQMFAWARAQFNKAHKLGKYAAK